jgi:thiol-disulfide isomerase/thioredoxin
MSSTGKSSSTSPAYKKLAALAGCAVVAASAGVYAIFGGEGNAPVGVSAAQAGQTADIALDKSLSTGAIAAFVFKSGRADIDSGPFKNADGKEMTLADRKGKVVLVNLWATWCAPCRKEMPDLAQLQKDYGGDDFEVVAISVDLKGADASSAFLKEIGADNLALYTDKTTRVMKKLGAIGLPVTILIDRQGKEIGRLLGPAHWTADEARKLIEAAIAEKPAS